MNKVNIHKKLALINDQWNPRVVGEMNGQQVRLVKLQGHDFEMHMHPDEEMFFIVKGELILEFEDRKELLQEGDFYIIPRGTLHRPVCDNEAEVMLFVAAENINTGDVENNFTISKNNIERI